MLPKEPEPDTTFQFGELEDLLLIHPKIRIPRSACLSTHQGLGSAALQWDGCLNQGLRGPGGGGNQCGSPGPPACRAPTSPAVSSSLQMSQSWVTLDQFSPKKPWVSGPISSVAAPWTATGRCGSRQDREAAALPHPCRSRWWSCPWC